MKYIIMILTIAWFIGYVVFLTKLNINVKQASDSYAQYLIDGGF